MSTEALVILIVAIVVVAAVVAIGWSMQTRRRALRQQFGPEYERALEQHESRKDAESELTQRRQRVDSLDIAPLTPESHERYSREWLAVQERFVDTPREAVGEADRLVTELMRERGYPTEGYDQMLADLSVEHARTLDHYRAGHDLSERAAADQASTEDLRQALIHYRALFEDLLGEPDTDDEREVMDRADDRDMTRMDDVDGMDDDVTAQPQTPRHTRR